MGETVNIDEYTELKVEDGDYGIKIIEGWIGRDGDFKPSFCKREFKKGSGEKTCPVSLKLGKDSAKAAAALRTLAYQIDGGRGESADPGPLPSDDVPF